MHNYEVKGGWILNVFDDLDRAHQVVLATSDIGRGER